MNHMAPATIPLKSGTLLTQIQGTSKYNRQEPSLLAYPKHPLTTVTCSIAMHWYNRVLGNQLGVYNEPTAPFPYGLLTNWHDSIGNNSVVYVQPK
jgi:hypothetical protein